HEIQSFLKQGHINFPDEVVVGKALSQLFNTPEPVSEAISLPKIDIEKIRSVIETASEGYLDAAQTQKLLDSAGIPRVTELVENSKEKLLAAIDFLEF